jgi:hypothetical protein
VIFKNHKGTQCTKFNLGVKVLRLSLWDLEFETL